jgi:hypothetical protein
MGSPPAYTIQINDGDGDGPFFVGEFTVGRDGLALTVYERPIGGRHGAAWAEAFQQWLQEAKVKVRTHDELLALKDAGEVEIVPRSRRLASAVEGRRRARPKQQGHAAS